MRRLVTPLIVVAVAGFTMGAVYRYLWDDPNPVPPTGKSTRTDYVYVMQFTGDKISHMTKIWHSGLALKELGWA
jgi:hypothetical protein